MTTDIQLSTQISVAVYYALTIKLADNPREPEDRVQKCNYYVYAGGELVQMPAETNSNRVILPTVPSAGGFEYVCLKHLTDIGSHKLVPALDPLYVIDTDVTLVSAVAGAQDPVVDEQLPSTFVASISEDDSLPSVVIPVSSGASRGSILIFEEHAKTGEFLGLRASLDPEIRGSIGGTGN